MITKPGSMRALIGWSPDRVTSCEPQGNSRPSWDQTATLYGILGAEGDWGAVAGTNVVHSNGTNAWEAGDGGGMHYLTFDAPPEAVAQQIEDLMVSAGKARQRRVEVWVRGGAR
jgi:hypothetical protein